MEKYVEQLPSVDEQVGSLLGTDVFVAVLDQIPDAWLEPVPGAATPAAVRAAYVAFLDARLSSRDWLPGAAT